MAEEQKDKKPRIRKSAPSMREQAEKTRASESKAKPKRIRKVTGGVKKPLATVAKAGRQEFYLPLPDTKWGRFLNKRRRVIPSYFVNSWGELKLVTWTGRRETWRLTMAVFMFAIIFGLLVAGVDKILEEVFKKIIL